MKKKWLLFPFIIIALSTLSACGFHLRKNPINLAQKYPVIVLPFTGSHTLHQALFRALSTASIQVVEELATEACAPQLQVVTQHLGKRPLVYGEDSELRRERLTMSITFAFGQTTLKEFVLSTERDHQLNSNQHLGDNAEKIIIEREMQADIIAQLLRYMDSEQFQ